MSTTAPRPGGTGRSREAGTSGAGAADAGTADPDAGRALLSPAEADRAARTYWEAEADAYQAEHGAFLAGGERWDGGAGAGFVWGPEGLSEAEAELLGPPAALRGRRVLEVGCGAAQCSAWLAARGADAVGIDIAMNQLRHAKRAPRREQRAAATADHDARTGEHDVADHEGGAFMSVERPEPTRSRMGEPTGLGGAARHGGATRGESAVGGAMSVVAATATALPFRDRTFSAAFSAYGAVQFVADLDQLLAEVRRVLEPGGRWVFSVTHPIRWAFPDDPGPDGLTATMSYFDRTPYVEVDAAGAPAYAEFHRTLGDYVAPLAAGGFIIESIVEPEWPEWNHAEWGGWSPLRGAHLPGTLIIGCRAGG